VAGTRELRVRGRASGHWRAVVVNLPIVDGQRYLLAPRGQTQWVHNLRAAGGGELRLGRRREAFRAREVADAAKVPVLREYLRRWDWQVSGFLDGVDRHADDDRLAAVAARLPVFLIETAR
jgi:hypothetical protein